MKSISAIHPAITENTENILVKWIRESLNASILAMPNSFKQGIAREVPQQSLYLVLKLLRVYHQSSPYAVVKKSMGDQRGTKVYSTLMQAL